MNLEPEVGYFRTQFLKPQIVKKWIAQFFLLVPNSSNCESTL